MLAGDARGVSRPQSERAFAAHASAAEVHGIDYGGALEQIPTLAENRVCEPIEDSPGVTEAKANLNKAMASGAGE